MGRVVRLPGREPIQYDLLTDEQRALVDESLALWLSEVEANPLQGFEPFDAQKAFLSAGRVKHKMALAGNRAGKTEVGVVDDLIQCVDRDCLPSWLADFKFWEPPFFCRVVTMDLEGTLHGVMLPKWQKLTPRAQLRGGAWDKAYDKSNRVLHFKNGSWVQFMSASQDREKHQGAMLDRVHFDEEPPPPHGESIYEENRRRCIDRRGQVMFTMTPLMGLSWTYDTIYSKRGETGYSVSKWSMLDNPHLPPEEVQLEIATCKTEKQRQAVINGDFVAFRGRVFEEFDEDAHVVDPLSPKDLEGQTVLIGYDPGIARGGVVWVAFDGRNNLTVFDEMYPERMSVEAISEEMRRRNSFWRVRPEYIVIDPASATPSTVTARETVQSELQRLGWAVVPGQNDRMAGIMELKGRMETGALKVSRSCQNWLRECDRYLVARDEETAAGVPKSGKGAGGSFATLGADHLLDPTRYVAMDRIWVRPPAAGPEDLRKRHWEPGRAPHGAWLRPPAAAGPPMGSMS